MIQGERSRSTKRSKRIFKPLHEEPKDFAYDYILLPFGYFYDKTKDILDARSGDVLRFYNGPERSILCVSLIEDEKMCNTLCLLRYGVTWEVAFRRWVKYARLEGHGKDVLCKDKCIMLVYEKKD